MKKYISLIKACMSEGMNIFKVSTKNRKSSKRVIFPIILSLMLMGMVYSYSEGIILQLESVHMEFVLLTLFVIITSLLTLTEGVYKSGNLLFNCKDDNLLFSLPVKKSTVLFIRILKFYLFELAYNSLIIFPTMLVYAIHVHPSATYYLVSFFGLLLFPIIPILLSCMIGSLITFTSSKFKGKNMVQTLLTIIIVLIIMFLSFNTEKILTNIAKNATSINDLITKLYYPAGAYIELITSFNTLKLFEFIFVNVGLFLFTIFLIGRVYFKINSSVKSIKVMKNHKNYTIKTLKPIEALITKEFNRFFNSPVFIVNAGFGLVLHILGCGFLVLKSDIIVDMVTQIDASISLEYINSLIPLILFALICFTSFLTSITSSMISLEGKSFNILKSLPLKPYTIIRTKVLAAVLIIIPCILVGNMIVFIKFQFNLIHIILITFASFILPLLTEIIGIIVNLKYPRMDAKNDTEVVKQSMSSAVSVLIGMGLIGLTLFLIFEALSINIANDIIILSFVWIYLIVCIILSLILQKTSTKSFNNISV